MALGGSGEAGPMGIPQYGYGDDDGSGGYGDGDSDTGGMGSGDSDTGGGGGGGGGNDSGNDSDNASDDEMGDVGVMGGPGYSRFPDDTDSTEVAQDQLMRHMGFDVFDSIDDFNQQQAKDRAIKRCLCHRQI